MACLSSRFPYGTPITADGLRMVDRAEGYLRDSVGFTQLRSRHHVEVARIELPVEDVSRLIADADMRQELNTEYNEIGYDQVVVDLRGFRSGSMNEVLLQVDSEPDDPARRIDPILADLELTPALWVQREQMLCLRLPAAAFPRLSDPELRFRLVSRIEALSFRYVALDLQPLTE
jgi:hypothetical protein